MCVLILLYMCPHTAVYVFAYCFKCVLRLLYMCFHAAVYASGYYNAWVLLQEDPCIVVSGSIRYAIHVSAAALHEIPVIVN